MSTTTDDPVLAAARAWCAASSYDYDEEQVQGIAAFARQQIDAAVAAARREAQSCPACRALHYLHTEGRDDG